MIWSDLYRFLGVYESPEYDVSSGFQTYYNSLLYHYEANDGQVGVFVRLSYDGSTWGDWIKINDVAYEELFRDEFYDMEYCKFQYKVEMTYFGGTSPKFLDFSLNLSGAYLIINDGDLVCKPELWITKRNASGTIKLTNETNGQVLELKNLNKDETVYIDCENEDIITDLPLKYRYNDHNNVFIELEIGENLLTGEGDFELVVRHEFKLLQG